MRHITTMVVALVLAGVSALALEGAIRAGTAQIEITPRVGLEIQHYYRISDGVHDPLFARCLYLETTSPP